MLQRSIGLSYFIKLSRLCSLTAAIVVFGVASFAYAQNISCTCRYKGEDYGIGESICLKSPDGMQMATCSMVLNNTSWKFSNAPCPYSSLEPENLVPNQSPAGALEYQRDKRAANAVEHG
ncbi:hypothetical protein ABVF61_24945 [Roseibium sp. HPY-6]|uniref:hypothetical protein n=1 Tax=Roseibium sp. HPY-6 TaxID=3229852 RepID=UPI00338F5F18